VLTAGAGPILRLTPPLVLTEAQAARGLELLDAALTEVETEIGAEAKADATTHSRTLSR
jgi:acetylornithine/succinyldiaminopimelate/putrescine aminotransferase